MIIKEKPVDQMPQPMRYHVPFATQMMNEDAMYVTQDECSWLIQYDDAQYQYCLRKLADAVLGRDACRYVIEHKQFATEDDNFELNEAQREVHYWDVLVQGFGRRLHNNCQLYEQMFGEGVSNG